MHLPVEFLEHCKQMKEKETKARKLMEKRLNDLKQLKSTTDYEKGLILLFSACLNQDVTYDDTEKQWNDLKKAGILIYNAKGMRGLHGDYIWDCMPKSIDRVVDMAWDGIGEWRS